MDFADVDGARAMSQVEALKKNPKISKIMKKLKIFEIFYFVGNRIPNVHTQKGIFEQKLFSHAIFWENA
jgi:hypothetical protein